MLGAFASAVSSALGQRSANKANERIAKENRAFQERMSSTSYQRAVRDMEAAGLNPGLMYSSGAGASTPGGATAQMSSETSGAVSSAQSAIRLRNEMKLQRQQISESEGREALNKAQEAKEEWQAHLAQAQARIQNRILHMYGHYDGDTWVPGPLEEKFHAETANAQQQARLTRFLADIREKESQFSDQSGTLPYWLRSLGTIFSPMLGGLGGAAVGTLLRRGSKPSRIPKSRRLTSGN